jgi:hypothetical protein
MPQALAVTDAVTTINQAETRFNLRRMTDPQFFVEWVEAVLPPCQMGKGALLHHKFSFESPC